MELPLVSMVNWKRNAFRENAEVSFRHVQFKVTKMPPRFLRDVKNSREWLKFENLVERKAIF
jgi:hypothetical protein